MLPKLILTTLVCLSISRIAFSCSGQSGNPSNGDNTGNGDNGNGNPPPNSPDSLASLAGPNVKAAPYDGSFFNQQGGGPAKNNGDLDCDFSKPCCWQNEQPPVDKYDWVQVTGDPDPDKLQQFTGTSTPPKSPYLATYTLKQGDPDSTAQFVSCSIACSSKDVKVTLKHWTTQGVKLQICEKDAFDSSAKPVSCQPIPSTSPGPDTVTLPAGQFFDIVIIAGGFDGPNGGLAVIDDIKVDFAPCQSSTASPTTTTAKGSPAPSGGGDAANCKSVNCDFEENNNCAYTPTSGGSGGGSSSGGSPGSTCGSSFTIQSGRCGNRDTGVPAPRSAAQHYIGSHFNPGQKGSLKSGDLNVADDSKAVKFWYYRATEGMKLNVCQDSESNCETVSGPGIQVADRQWQNAQVNIKKGTKTLYFVCDNTSGQNVGSCGIDAITLVNKQSGAKAC